MNHDWKLAQTAAVFARIRTNEKQRVIRNILLNLIIFCVVLLVSEFAEAFVLIIAMVVSAFSAGALNAPEIDVSAFMSSPQYMIAMLMLTSVCIALTFVYSLAIERRPIRTMGLTKRHFARDYAVGFVLGIAMFGAAVLLAWACGGLTCSGAATAIPWGSLLLFFCGWLIQGFSEELSFRGYLMATVGTHHKPWTAVLISSFMFAAAHLGNDGISFFAICNLTLFGIFAALYFLRTDSIWGAAALHSMWNCAQGNIFGLKVSGIDVDATFLRFEMTDKTWVNGGAFGLEGGAAVTVVLLAGIVIMFLLPQRKTEA